MRCQQIVAGCTKHEAHAGQAGIDRRQVYRRIMGSGIGAWSAPLLCMALVLATACGAAALAADAAAETEGAAAAVTGLDAAAGGGAAAAFAGDSAVIPEAGDSLARVAAPGAQYQVNGLLVNGWECGIGNCGLCSAGRGRRIAAAAPSAAHEAGSTAGTFRYLWCSKRFAQRPAALL